MSYKLSLDEISIFINGGAWTEDVYVDEGYKVVRVTNMINGSVESRNDSFLEKSTYNKYIKHRLNTGDLIIATVGSHPTQEGSVVGRASIVPEEYEGALLNQNAVCIRIIDDRINQKFFNYLTKTILFRHHIESRAQGSANQVRMALSELKKFTFNYPIIEMQNNIVNLISNYDNLIENNNKRIKLLENMAEELYKEWFVRLRFPNYQNTKIIDGIPDGWEKKKLGDIFNTSSGGTPSRKNEQYFIGNIPWIKTGELKDIFVLDTEEHISDEALNNSSAKLFQENTIIIAMYCAMPYLSILLKPSSTNQACCAFLPKQEYLDYSFIYFFIKNVQQGLILHAHGAAQQNLSQEIISNYESILPFKELIVQYSEIAKPLFEKIKILMIKNQNLKETRDLLLPRLISGKLDIKNLDIV